MQLLGKQEVEGRALPRQAVQLGRSLEGGAGENGKVYGQRAGWGLGPKEFCLLRFCSFGQGPAFG